ncbi:Similar to XKR6: XK-related protein 6 (Homo sapiens) [Cotesia congregata]|uniref:XK-related protein n=1 Tax=Cotesia congregata TaxID=51543 RepID=A0A8J2E587_COTCN|nr:Similar to XKR6: XK-related protein 6 (Homo sapiens) [Cotesia congregata]
MRHTGNTKVACNDANNGRTLLIIRGLQTVYEFVPIILKDVISSDIKKNTPPKRLLVSNAVPTLLPPDNILKMPKNMPKPPLTNSTAKNLLVNVNNDEVIFERPALKDECSHNDRGITFEVRKATDTEPALINIETNSFVKISLRGKKSRKSQEPDPNDNSELDGVFPIPNFNTDVADLPESKALVTRLDIFWIIFSIITHLVDLGTDLNLSFRYYIKGQLMYFFITTAFLFIPSFINIIVSIRMYEQDSEMKAEGIKKQTLARRILKLKLCCPFILVFQLAPVLRYLDCLKYACQSYQCRKDNDNYGQRKYYIKMLKEEQDISLLRVFECFLEAAPHLVLQLTLIIYTYDGIVAVDSIFFHQLISILSALGSMGWAMSSYHRIIRLAQVSRIISISAAAAIFAVYTTIFCFIHWFIMTLWILSRPTGVIQFCRDQSKGSDAPLTIYERIGYYLFSAILGVVYVFTYLKPAEGSTFYRHIFYYTICGIENAAACIVWAIADYNTVLFLRSINLEYQSTGFCTTIRINSLSGATMTSCFLLRIRKNVRSFVGSRSRTTERALSDNWLINPAY